MSESVLEQIYRQQHQILQMVGMRPGDRPEYLRLTAIERQAMSQSGLFQLQRPLSKDECQDRQKGFPQKP